MQGPTSTRTMERPQRMSGQTSLLCPQAQRSAQLSTFSPRAVKTQVLRLPSMTAAFSALANLSFPSSLRLARPYCDIRHPMEFFSMVAFLLYNALSASVLPSPSQNACDLSPYSFMPRRDNSRSNRGHQSSRPSLQCFSTKSPLHKQICGSDALPFLQSYI
jgi:hypothetical protein